MKEIAGPYKVHVFFCINDKKSGASCGQKDAEKLHKELKAWAKAHPDWKDRIRINKSGCLDRCSEGIAVAVYPQNEWFLKVDESNLDELKKHIEELMAESD
jgi:(2Fe-2S) ferredoxin